MEEKTWKDRLREAAGRHSSRRGAFSAGLTALAVAAVVVFNLVAPSCRRAGPSST